MFLQAFVYRCLVRGGSPIFQRGPHIFSEGGLLFWGRGVSPILSKMEDPPPQYGNMIKINARSVRILLECIVLVDLFMSVATLDKL